jgi:2-amino-4-hydroxy-6-hydroxymethyldihydropteridine diphosphokinase
MATTAYLALGANLGDRSATLDEARARVTSTLAADALLAACLEIERALGRVRPAGQVHAARTLDIDLLLYGDAVIDDPPALIVPHPRMLERPFVLIPLADVAAPGLRHPKTGKRLDEPDPRSG